MTKKKTADKRRQEIITEKRKAARIQTRPEIEMLAVDRLVPYAKNAKKHDDRQVAAIAGSIREFGFTNPVLIDGQDGIIAGHGRVLGARKAGLAEVPCIRLAHLTDAQRRAYILADNRLAETGGGWDAAMLAAEVESIDWAELDAFKLDDMDLGEILAEAERGKEGDADAEPQVDRAEELNQTWGVKAGDLWLVGEHRLVCGDSTKAEDVAMVLGDARPVLMVTDPPYGVEYDANWRNEADRANGKPYGARAVGRVTNDDRADWSAAWKLFCGDVAYVYHANVRSHEVAISLIASGFGVRALIIWAKSNFAIGRGHYHNKHEPCWYVVREGKTGHWIGDHSQTTLWEIDKSQKSETGHSTQKPVECMARPMRNHDAPEVYDPFLGSGTTMVAAQNLSRKCYGLEISPAYCAVILQRMADAFPGIEIRKADA
jgi:DNA modification methylase